MRAAASRSSAANSARAALLAAALFGCRERAAAPPPASPAAPAPASFVGSEACAGCHAAEAAAWRASEHAHAIQPADANTVLADFSRAEFSVRDGQYRVHAAGPDGAPADFHVRYTFGVEPLQQYLLELPGGRLQAYTRAWDVSRKRWFDLYPGEKLAPGDELHWTGRQQNWNYMCADCHSTDVRKGFDFASRTYDTKFAELAVGCEACHGPGSAHVEWAKSKRGPLGLTVDLSERAGAHWTLDPQTGNSTRSRPRPDDAELEACAPCHARRSQLAEGWRAGHAFLDHYRPALLAEPAYWADGQQRAEDYTWGSFLQSKMYAHGVTCSDCHEPHSAALRAEGNALCERCHSAEKYDAPAHHFHRAGSPGARCVSCHMPAATYMQIDPRRDHSLRVPRPALSAALGAPDACTSCHRDKTQAWAASQLRRWLGHDPTGFQTFGPALHDAALNRDGAAAELVAVANDAAQPAVARASALALLAEHPGAGATEAGLRSAKDASALVRLGAAMLAGGLTAEARVAVAAPLCADPARAVRSEAASALAGAPRDLFTPAQGAAFARAADDYVAAQRWAADRPEAHVNLGSFFANLSRWDEAQAEFQNALALDARYVPALVNSADAYRAQGREDDALRELQKARELAPDSAPVRFSLGLALTRKGDRDAALAELERAVALAPDERLYGYTAAVALHSFGKSAEAIRRLESLRKRWPTDPDVLLALATMQRDAGNRAAARDAAQALLAARPGDPNARALLDQLDGREPAN
ncbi:MAG TPA: tetratricopeptide repeat protein [Myxococcota bacterium]|nr:tetratricopeptide repeat protein [Myxococcota bacterium]